jgi:hypothetical protein
LVLIDEGANACEEVVLVIGLSRLLGEEISGVVDDGLGIITERAHAAVGECASVVALVLLTGGFDGVFSNHKAVASVTQCSPFVTIGVGPGRLGSDLIEFQFEVFEERFKLCEWSRDVVTVVGKDYSWWWTNQMNGCVLFME